MPDDERRGDAGWGPWALVVGVGVVGVVALARELRDRRRGDGTSADTTDHEPDAGSDGAP